MLRVLIGTGLLLMAVGFGAAGWQYIQALPAGPEAEKANVEDADESQVPVWMISATGRVVPEPDARAYLEQDRMLSDRMAKLVVTARLDSLLLPGEKLPTAPYLEVLADIRAPRVVQTLCPMLATAFSGTCNIHSARVIPGSVNPIRYEARFVAELVYRQDVGRTELPDLAAHVLLSEDVLPDPDVLPAATVEAAFSELLATAVSACGADDRAATCRLVGLEMDWAPGTARQAKARIAWLAPLPEGFRDLAPIAPSPGG